MLADLGEPTSFFDHAYLGRTQRECKPNDNIVDQYRKIVESRTSAGASENCQGGKNLTQKLSRGPTSEKNLRDQSQIGHELVFYVGNTARHCRLGLFQDSDFAGDLEDSESTSGDIVCIFGSRTFVPRSWMCKKQTSVSHSSTESEVISLDAGMRLGGLLALDSWSVVMEV